jgi:hypothetical protein
MNKNPVERRKIRLLRYKKMNNNKTDKKQTGKKYFKPVNCPVSVNSESPSWMLPKNRKSIVAQEVKMADFPVFRKIR